MPPHLFHQNMRTFGAGNGARNFAYAAGFTAVQAPMLPGNPIEVAGLTELTNSNAAMIPALNPIVNCLVPGMAVRGVAACGIMAVGNKTEYLAIATRPGVAITGWGRVHVRIRGQETSLVHDRSPQVPPTAAWLNDDAKPPTADIRSVVYVVVTLSSNRTIVVGFVHNIYRSWEHRVLFMGRIADIMAMMGTSAPGSDVFLGGDFNVPPFDRKGRGIPTAWKHAADVTNWRATYPVPPMAKGTTQLGRNLFDYWYVTWFPNPRFVMPTASGQTMDVLAGMSDHAAVLIST